MISPREEERANKMADTLMPQLTSYQLWAVRISPLPVPLPPSSEAMHKDTKIFLLIEEYGDSKSRTKIGVSVDTKV